MKTTSRLCRAACRALAGYAAFLLFHPAARTQVTWDNDSLDSLWSTGANWSGGAEPGSGSAAIFPTPIPGGAAITLGTGEQAGSLSFAAGYMLTAGNLTIASGGIDVGAGVTATINSVLQGAGGLTKTDTGTLVLGGTNTFTNGVQINAGAIRTASASALGNSANVVTVNSGGTLELGVTTDRSLAMNHGSTLRATTTLASNNALAVAAGATVTIAAGGLATDVFTLTTADGEFSGGDGTSLVVANGPGAIRISTASDYMGSWRVDSGTVHLGDTLALGSNGAGTLTLNGGAVAGRISGTQSFTASPANNVVVQANSSLISDRTAAGVGGTYTFGALSIGGQTLTVASGANATSGTAAIVLGAVTLSGNATFAVNDGAAAVGKLTVGSLNGGGVARTITRSGDGDLAITGGSTSLAAGSQILSNGSGTLEGIFPTLGAGATITPTAAQNPFGPASVQVTGGLRLLADGDGGSTAQTIVLGNSFSFSGDVTVDPDRRTSPNLNKTFQIPTLPLAAGTVLRMSGNNGYGLRVAGATTLQGDATIRGATAASKDGLLVFGGGIGDGGGGHQLTLGASDDVSPLNLTLNATSTYSGGTQIGGGTVNANAANSLGTGPITMTGGTLIAGAASALGPGAITMNGSPTLRITETAAMQSNAINLNGGTLDLRSENSTPFTTGTLTLGGDATINVQDISSGVAKTLSLAQALNVSGNRTLSATNVSSYQLNLSGGVNLAGDLRVDTSSTSDVRVQAISQDATPRKLIKGGTGILELEAASTHSGGTEVLAGTLQVEHSNALGGGPVTLGDTSGTATATLRLAAGVTASNPITIRSGSSGTATLTTSGAATFAGDVTLQKNVVLGNTVSLTEATLSGKISGAFDLTINATGTVVLTNAMNSFGTGGPGGLTISGGGLKVTNNGAMGNAANGVTINGSRDFIVDGTFSTNRVVTLGTGLPEIFVTTGNTLTLTQPFGGTGTLTKSDAGTLAFGTGVNNTRTSATTLAGGTLRLTGATSLSTAGPISVTGDSVIELLNDANTNYAHALTHTTFPIPALTINVDRAVGGSGTGGTHTLGDLSTSGTVTITGSHGYGLTLGAVTATGVPVITNDAPGPLTLSSLTLPTSFSETFSIGGSGGNIGITGATSGSSSFTKTGTNTVTLGTSAGWTGGTAVLSGKLDFNGLSNSGTIDLGGGAAGTLAEIVTGAGTLTTTSITYNAANNPLGAVLRGNLRVGGSGTFTVGDSANAAVDLEIDGPISESAAGTPLNKNGAGVLRVSGAGNTYTGLTTLNAGTLELNKSTGLAIGAAGLDVGGLIGSGTVRLLAAEQIHNSAMVEVTGTFDLNGFTETIGAAAFISSSSSATIVATGAAGRLVLGGDVTLNNIVLGTPNHRRLLITGTGSEAVVVPSGTLDLGGATRTFTVTTSAVGNVSSVTIETAIINGGVIKAGPSRLTFSNNNTYAGGTTITNGNLEITNTTSSTGLGPVAISGGISATLSGTGVATGATTVTNGSRLAPGLNTTDADGSGRYNFGVGGPLGAGSTGGLTLTNAHLDFDLATTAASTMDDQINTAALSLGSTIAFTFNGLGGTLQPGVPYLLINATSVSGFNAGNISSTFLGPLAGSYTATYSVNGTNDLMVTFIPEPSAGALLACGLGILTGFRRFCGTRRPSGRAL